MTWLDWRDGQWMLGDGSVRRLAERAGQTPFYVVDRRRVTERVQAVRQVLPPGVRLYYAVKANPMPALLGHLAGLVDGMDVASGGELNAALNAGCAPADVCFAGPGKTELELRQAVAAGALLHVESLREVRLLGELARSWGLSPALGPRVALRVNPDFELRSAGMRMGGGAQVFGVDAEQVPTVLAELVREGLRFEGFHVYAGSQILKAEVLVSVLERTLDMLRGWAQQCPSPVLSVNVGGGWGIPYHAGETPLDIQAVGQAMGRLWPALQQVWPQAHMTVELGRYLVGEAGAYVCRVLERKESRGQVFVVTDGGMHHHLAAAGHFGQLIRRPYPVALAGAAPGGPTERVNVVGPLCTPMDTLAQQVELPRAEPGDLVVVFQSGAYGASASPQRFLSHPAPAEILL